jgi:hypothetical protein
MAKSTTKTEPTVKKATPAHEIRSGAIRAVIWKNETDKGTWYSTNITRSYKAGEEWRETSHYNRDDLLVVSKVSELAFLWIMQQN